MRIHRLRVTDFAGIREADVEFGPGLNVLYGPNDLGKSTLAEAIRLALLLPCTSTHIDDYVPWSGGQNPVVELTFESEAQRIWRVRKEFRKSGTATLEESKNGVDFDEVERARKVDGTLREILRWGIPEPGGTGGSKGLPSSFLATVLLSTQANVTAILSESLNDDSIGTGKERIAAALQAVAQDPLFLALLNATQARRDQAYTEKGARKSAKGSPFKEASDRVREARDAKERLQQAVDDSAAVEKELVELTATRDWRENAVNAAKQRVKLLEQLAEQSAVRLAAAEEVRRAREAVERIQTLDGEIRTAEENLRTFALDVTNAEEALKAARRQHEDATVTLQQAQNAAAADGTDAQTKLTFRLQSLELSRNESERKGREARQRIEAVQAAEKLVAAAATAAAGYQVLRSETEAARDAHNAAVTGAQERRTQLERLDLLERGHAMRTAEAHVAAARTAVAQAAMLRSQLEQETGALDVLSSARDAITVPAIASLRSLRELENTLAGARGALSVGFVVTVTPRRAIDMRVAADGKPAVNTTTAEAMELEANAAIDLGVGDVADIRIRGGHRDTQDIVRALEMRWKEEVEPLLAAAGAADLNGLAAWIEERQALDTAITLKESGLASLRERLASLADASDTLSASAARLEASRAALGDASVASLMTEIEALGDDPAVSLRAMKQEGSTALEIARQALTRTATAVTLAEDRLLRAKATWEEAVAVRDAESVKFPEGLSFELSAAQSAAAAAADEQEKIAAEKTSIENAIAEQTARLADDVRTARAAATLAQERREHAETTHTNVVKKHAGEEGRLETLRKQRELQDLQSAEEVWRNASDDYSRLPVPTEEVTPADVLNARNKEAAATEDLKRTVGEIHKAQGRLEQVGGAVARERLREAEEACKRVEDHEHEVELEYEAWLLLLQQMKEADAAQASNLGQALAPALTGHFEKLTEKRYDGVSLTAQLGTDGVVVGGVLRTPDRLSVGTREQLSTLYRLSLAEYLGTALVLDDQLVQSDESRMDWFRALLADKARVFQIIVFTCRPSDYLEASALAQTGQAPTTSMTGGVVRATDLAAVIRRR